MKDFQKSMIDLEKKEKAIIESKKGLVKQAVELRDKKQFSFLDVHDKYERIVNRVQGVANTVNGKFRKIADSKKDKITEDVASLDNFIRNNNI